MGLEFSILLFYVIFFQYFNEIQFRRTMKIANLEFYERKLRSTIWCGYFGLVRKWESRMVSSTKDQKMLWHIVYLKTFRHHSILALHLTRFWNYNIAQRCIIKTYLHHYYPAKYNIKTSQFYNTFFFPLLAKVWVLSCCLNKVGYLNYSQFCKKFSSAQ